MDFLIVDDQADAREELREILKQACVGDISLREAASGLAALDEIQRAEPDVIFLDMNMPHMDGAAFLRAYTKTKASSVLIVLSAYNDFEYMQSAVRYKADHYLLKPIRTGDLYEVLLIAHERRSPTGADGRIDAELRHYLDELLFEFLNGSDHFVNVERIFERAQVAYEAEVSFCAMVAGGAGWSGKALAKALEQTVAGRECPVYWLGRDERAIGVCPSRALPDVRGLARAVSELDGALRLGLSAPVAGMRALSGAYRQAEQAFWAGVQSGDAVTEYARQAAPLSREFEAAAQAMIDAIVRGDRKVLDEVAAALFRGELMRPGQPVEHFASLCQLIGLLISQLEQAYPHLMRAAGLERYALQMKFCRALSACQSAFDAKVLLIRFLESLLSALEKIAPEQKVDFIVQTILNYIAQNYRQPLTVTRIANELSMNYSYISNLFSRKMGVTMTSYINTYRLERARELLLGGHDKVYVIGKLAGFYDAKNFAKLFKKAYGVTPTEYRSQHIER